MNKEISDLQYSRISSTPVLRREGSKSLYAGQITLTPNNELKSSIRPSQELRKSSPSFQKPSDRPISLTIIEKYFSEISINISEKKTIDFSLLSKLETMKEVVVDCLKTVTDISEEIFSLIISALNDLHFIKKTGETKDLNVLMNKLLQIGFLIEDDRFRSKVKPAIKSYLSKSPAEPDGDLAMELETRVSRVSARLLNIWKKIISTQREIGIICSGFLLLFCEVDRSIKVSPFFKVKLDQAVNMMREYCANPGHVVSIIRKTKEFIESEKISNEVIRKIQDLLGKVSKESVKISDITMTAFALYELLIYAVKYHEFCQIKKQGFSPADSLTAKIKKSEIKEPLVSHLEHPTPSTDCLFRSVDSLSPLKSKRSLLTSTVSKSPNKTKIYQSNIQSRTYDKSTSQVCQKGLRNSPQPKHKQTTYKKIVSARTDRKKGVSPIEVSPSRGLKTARLKKKEVKRPGLLEEVQYQQFMEEVFKSFLSEKMTLKDSILSKSCPEEIMEKHRESWMQEFEGLVERIRNEVIEKLGEEKRFNSEVLRAKKQLEIENKI